MNTPTTPNTDRNGDPIVGDILDIIDKGESKRYAVAVRVAEYVRNRITQAERRAELIGRLDEWANCRDAWHGTTDDEFSARMNIRKAELEAEVNALQENQANV